MIDFGTYWTPDSTVTLLRVPWDAAYSDVVDWGYGTSKRDAWMVEAEKSGYDFSNSFAYHRTSSRLVVDASYASVYQYNYVHVHNGGVDGVNDTELDFYYFILDAEYLNPASTALTLQLDVWTTYAPRTHFIGGFVDRGHLLMADNAANDTSDIPHTLRTYYVAPEGLDTGDRFLGYRKEFYTFQSYTENDYILIGSTAALEDSWGTISDPKLHTATGGVVNGLYTGTQYYLLTKQNFQSLMSQLSEASWVAQCIVSITVVPSLLVKVLKLGDTTVETNLNGGSGASCLHLSPSPQRQSIAAKPLDMEKISGKGWTSLTEKYKDLKKLWTYPYSVIEMTTFSGSTLALKPQYLDGNTDDVMYSSTLIAPNPRVCIWPRFYGEYGGQIVAKANAFTADDSTADDKRWTFDWSMGDDTETAIWISDFPQFSLVNNSGALSIAQQAHSLQWQYDNADWNLSNSKKNAEVARDITSNNIAYSDAAQRQAISNRVGSLYTSEAQGIGGAISDVVTSAVSAGLTGAKVGPVGAAGGAAIGAGLSLITQGLGFNNTANTINADEALNQKNIDTQNINKRLTYRNSVRQAEGNYDQTIASIQAGVADAALTQPSIVGQAGGNGWRYANGLQWQYAIRYMRVNEDAIIRAGQYFRRFGYSTLRYMNFPSNYLNVCRYFSYYKVQDMQFPDSPADEANRSALREIFTRGVTIWETPELIGAVDISDNTVNSERMGDYLGD